VFDKSGCFDWGFRTLVNTYSAHAVQPTNIIYQLPYCFVSVGKLAKIGMPLADLLIGEWCGSNPTISFLFMELPLAIRQMFS
jgi:hypothetical protein